MRHIVTLALALVLPFLLAADDAPAPRSAAAVTAMRKAEAARKAADQAWTKAMLSAEQDLLKELQDAKAAAMALKSDAGLSEANAIQREIEAAEKRIGELSGKARSDVVDIDAAKDWQGAVEVRKGQRISVKADGEWCADTGNPADWTCGPVGMMHKKRNVRAFYLEGRIDGGEPFPVGASLSFTAPASGKLELRMNETGGRDDNRGTVRATISH